MHLTYLVDMRKITFYKKLKLTDNSTMLILFNIVHAEINAICAKYYIVLNYCNLQ